MNKIIKVVIFIIINLFIFLNCFFTTNINAILLQSKNIEIKLKNSSNSDTMYLLVKADPEILEDGYGIDEVMQEYIEDGFHLLENYNDGKFRIDYNYENKNNYKFKILVKRADGQVILSEEYTTAFQYYQAENTAGLTRKVCSRI